MLAENKKKAFANNSISFRGAGNKDTFLFHKNKKKYGQSTMEYMLLITFIIGAMLVFHKYIVRGMWGQWKTIGDSFGSGRLYDPMNIAD